MYAVEYTWISDPIPVTTRIIKADKGSTRSVKLTLKAPDVIQLKTRWLTRRDSGGSAARFHAVTTAMRNDASTEPQAIVPAAALPTRRPRPAVSRKPTNGRSGIRRSTSPLERRERIGIERFAMTEEGDDDGETHGCLGRRDRHREENDDLSVRRAERAAEGHERQVDGVQHDFNRQKDRDQVPPDEDAGRADGKQHRGKHEVIVERRHHLETGRASVSRSGVSRRARTTAPSMATRISTDVTSNAKAYSVNSSRPMIATDVTEPPGKTHDSPPCFVRAQTS